MAVCAVVCAGVAVGVCLCALCSGSRVEQDAAYQQLWVADELMDKSDGLADPDTPHVTLRGEVRLKRQPSLTVFCVPIHPFSSSPFALSHYF